MWRHWFLALLFGMLATGHGWALSMNVKTDDSEKLAYVNLWDHVDAGDDRKFRALILPYLQAGYVIFQVNIFSPGGDSDAAMGIGEQIRTLNAQTQGPVKREGFLGTDVECRFAEASGGRIVPRVISGTTYPWCTCTSACFLVWAAGFRREGNYVGMHRFRFEEKVFATWPAEQARSRYVDWQERETLYLRKLGVPSSMIELMFAVNSESMHFLTESQLQLMQSNPYVEELIRARCGLAKGTTTREGDSYVRPYEAADKACYRATLREFMREGVRSYLRGR
jgi:hypothetical protein